MNCSYCLSSNVQYKGVDDGQGDYGDELCDVWFCNSCEQEFTDGCIGGEGDDDEW